MSDRDLAAFVPALFVLGSIAFLIGNLILLWRAVR